MIFLLALLAAPGWAQKPDSADAAGHVFTCEGQGATEEDALASASGICNDKICKVCGVEVESVTETRETLTGVDLSRKVVERCRRVRKSDTKLRAKSVDCSPDGCQAWIQIFYSTDDQKQECGTYTRDDFTDPAACEKDVQAFRAVEGRTAGSLRQRARALDEALVHCAKIDVRPTPAILALDEKLKAGMASFEFVAREDQDWRPTYGYWLEKDEALHSQIAESKLLVDRIKLVRDYVANRALVFDVLEAFDARDHDTPQGIARIRDALLNAPTGKQYGSRYDIHFSAAGSIWRWKSDTSPLDEALRKLYKPEDSLTREGSWDVAKLFANKQRITAADWDWVFAAHQHDYCGPCIRSLLQVPKHEGGDRVERAVQAVKTLRTNTPGAYYDLIGYNTPDLALDLESNLAPDLRAQAYSWKYMKELLTRFHEKEAPPELSRRLARRAAQALALEKDCILLADEVKRVEFDASASALLDQRTCACLTGELRNQTHLANRDDLVEHARLRKLACLKGLPTDE